MLPEDRLDALLSRGPAREATPTDEGLSRLLETAQRLEPLRAAAPRPIFAETLQDLILARAAAIRAGGDVTEPMAAAPGRSLSFGREGAPLRLPHLAPLRRRRRSPLMWQVAAAAVLVFLLGGGFLAAGASAAPGTPFYGLHRWEQGFRAGLAPSPADKVSLHLSYADDALQSFDGTVADHGSDASLADALTTILSEQNAAAEELASVSSAAEHQALATQLASFSQQASRDLRAALPQIDWASRLRATTTLGGLGEQVPSVSSVRFTQGDDDVKNAPWHVQVQGAGFATGAILVVDGQPGGTVLSVTPTLLVAEWSNGAPPHGVSVGVQNPDGTAAQTGNVTFHSDDNDDATPSAGGGGGGDDDGGSSTGTPTRDR